MQNRKTSLEFKTGNQSRSPIRSMMKVIEDEFGPIRNFYEEWSAASDARRPYLIAQTQQERWEGLKVFYAFYLDEMRCRKCKDAPNPSGYPPHWKWKTEKGYRGHKCKG